MQYLKQSTAVTLKIGPFLDDTDGKTSETALTIAQADVRLSKNGGDIAQKTEATSCTHDELGVYGCPIDATDTATLGRLQLWVHESGALPVWHEFLVIPANVYDSLFSTDKLQVDVTQLLGTAWLTPGVAGTPDVNAKLLGGTAQTGNDVGADVNDILTDTGTTLDALIKDIPTVAEFEARSILAADYVVVSDTIAGVTAVTNDVGITQAGADKVWGTAARALTDKAGFALSAAGITSIWNKNISAFAGAGYAGTYIKNLYDNQGNWLTATGFSTHNAAAVWSAGSRELSTPANYKADVSSLALEATLTAIKGATFDTGTDSLEAIRNQGDSAWITATGFSTHTAANVWSVATRALTDKADFTLSTAGILAIWHQLTANIVTANTIGKLLKDDINATISSRSSHDAAAVWSAGSRALSTPADYKADVSALALEATLTAMKGATFVEATDSLEAIRDRGDAAWTTGAGGSDRLLMVDTTIATLASQTSFTLNAGSTDDGAYNNCTIVIEDAATATQKVVGLISNYVGSTKTITLKYDPGIFTIAITDKVYILAENALKATLANRQLNVAADGDIAGNVDGSVASVVGHTVQTGDSYAIVNSGTYGNSVIEALVDELESRLTAARAGYLDNINNANLATIADISTLTATEIAYLNASISSRSSHTASAIWSVGTRALTDKAGFSLAAAAITTIWEKDISAFSGVGYAGTYLKTLYDDWLNAGRLDLILDAIAADVVNIDGDAMRGTDSAALASVCTEPRLAELAAANLPADVAAILADTGTDGVVVASGSKTGYALTDAGVDAILDEVVEGTLTFRQMLRLFTSVLAGKSAGGGTVTLTFRDIADGKDRISATVDTDGNRTAISLDGA